MLHKLTYIGVAVGPELVWEFDADSRGQRPLPQGGNSAQKKPGRKAPAVSLDSPGSSSRASGWILTEDRVAEVPALPGALLCHSWLSPPIP